jgi:hypothetical protein
LDAARQCSSADAEAVAADALLRVQIMWWEFARALETADVGLEAARRANWVAEGAFRLTRGLLWYYLQDYARAADELERAREAAVDQHGERRWLVSLAGVDRLKLGFFAAYVLGVVAAARSQWGAAIETARELSRANLFAVSYMVRNNVLHLWVDGLLGQNGDGDVAAAAELVARLEDDEYEQGSILDFSNCVELTRARVAAAAGGPDAAMALEKAFASVRRLAALRPLDCDRAFDQLAQSATLLGERGLADRAAGLAAEFRAARLIPAL